MTDKNTEKIIKRVQNESDKRMKRYLGALNEHTDSRFKAVIEGFDGINRKLDEHTEKLDEHTEMIGSLMEDMTEVKDSLTQKVERYEFETLSRRVSLVEKKVAR